jgi:hypothetical protein
MSKMCDEERMCFILKVPSTVRQPNEEFAYHNIKTIGRYAK